MVHELDVEDGCEPRPREGCSPCGRLKVTRGDRAYAVRVCSVGAAASTGDLRQMHDDDDGNQIFRNARIEAWIFTIGPLILQDGILLG